MEWTNDCTPLAFTCYFSIIGNPSSTDTITFIHCNDSSTFCTMSISINERIARAWIRILTNKIITGIIILFYHKMNFISKDVLYCSHNFQTNQDVYVVSLCKEVKELYITIIGHFTHWIKQYECNHICLIVLSLLIVICDLIVVTYIYYISHNEFMVHTFWMGVLVSSLLER